MFNNEMTTLGCFFQDRTPWARTCSSRQHKGYEGVRQDLWVYVYYQPRWACNQLMATARDIATPLLMLCRQLNNPTQQSIISFMCNAFIVTYHMQIQNDIIRDSIATSSIPRSITSCPSLCALFFVCQSKRQNSQSFPRPLATLKLLDFSFLGLLLPSLLFGWH